MGGFGSGCCSVVFGSSGIGVGFRCELEEDLGRVAAGVVFLSAVGGVPGQWVLQQGCFLSAVGVFGSGCGSRRWLWSLLGRGMPVGGVGSSLGVAAA